MNTRAKGQKNERRAQALLEKWGYVVFRLHQPMYSAQGPLDLIAVTNGCVRFIQVRTNSYHDLRPTKQFKELYAEKPMTPTVEAWLFTDGNTEPKQRVLE